MTRGRFITFEGIEGSGKSTQVRKLADLLIQDGHRVDVTREPGGTELSEAIRALLLAEQGAEADPRTQSLLHTAARAEHVAHRIEPNLNNGTHVISDRFYDSTLAYQGGGLGLPIEELLALQRFAIQGCEPDLRILLIIDPQSELPERLGARQDRNWIDDADAAFHSRVQAVFQQRATQNPAQWSVVDGAQPVEKVTDDIVATLRTRFQEFSQL